MEKKMTKVEMFSAIREVVSENAEMVAERIVKRFKAEYPKLKVNLRTAVAPIEVVI